MRRGRFIALEGGDGAGKTAAAEAIAAASGSDLCVLSRKDCSTSTPLARSTLPRLRDLLFAGYEGRDFVDSFWWHLQISWHIGLYASDIRPRLEAGSDVLIDGWIWKLVAKLIVQGHDETLLLSDMRPVAQPDTIVFVRASVATRATRRHSWSMSERGLHAGLDVDEPGAFARYQHAVEQQMTLLAERHMWTIVDMVPGDDRAAAAGRLKAVVDQARDEDGKRPPVS